MSKETQSKIIKTLYNMPYGAGISPSSETLRRTFSVDADEGLADLADYLEALRKRLAEHVDYHETVERELRRMKSDREATRRYLGSAIAEAGK
ncbi:MAG: hypothetical protein ACRDTI_21120 [Mycobacterium sp.]